MKRYIKSTSRDRVDILGVASGKGSKEPGCSRGPQEIRSQQIFTPDRYRWRDQLYANKRADIPRVCQQLARAVELRIQKRKKFLVLGGDHSIAIGTWSGVANAEQPIGLLWIDAHLDAHIYETSPSKALHGMPLSILLGRGDKEFLDLCYSSPALTASNVCLIGTRSSEIEEWKFLQSQRVAIFSMGDIFYKGLKEVLHKAIGKITKNTEQWGISLDLDVFDPEKVPGVSTPVSGGIDPSDLIPLLSKISQHPKFVGMEIVEFNPFKEKNRQTMKVISEVANAVFYGN